MTTLREAAQQALVALQELNGWQSLAPYAASRAAVQAAINLSAALAEQALEPQCNPHPKAPHGFLRNASHNEHRYVCECEGWEPYEAGYQAGMEAALAEPVQEPVAWRDHVEQRLLTWRQRFVNKSGDQLALDDFMDKQSLDDLIDWVCDEWATPPQRKPLTEEEIRNAISTFKAAEALMGVNHVHVARAIERAHGIKDA